MKPRISAVVFALMGAGTAFADCDYQGRSYGTGSVICAAGGWLQECTVADYWKTIGQCRAPDPKEPTTYTVIEAPADKPAEPEASKKAAD